MRGVWGSGEPPSRSRRRRGLEDSQRPGPTFSCWLASQFPLKGPEESGPSADSERKAESV